jgi:uncharacterized protein YndB with AHSA1/START domain
MNNSITLHRVFTCSPEKAFKAFSQPLAYSNWITPYGFLCDIHSYDFKIGGKFHISFINFGTGSKHSFGGELLEIVENKKIVYSDKFDNPSLTEVMSTSIEFNAVSCGVEITITQNNIPSVIPLEMCYLGWQESLDKLKRLIEPNIPDA